MKSVQRFLGLVRYFRKFILNFNLGEPLFETTKTKKNEWRKEQEEAFVSQRHRLMERPILRILFPELETELHTDASSSGFGAILLQKDRTTNKWYPVS